MIETGGMEALRALAAEAHRRGITYGRLVSGTTVMEQGEIIRKYKKTRRTGTKRRKKAD